MKIEKLLEFYKNYDKAIREKYELLEKSYLVPMNPRPDKN